LLAWNEAALISKNTAVASQPSRLLPSASAWSFTIDCNSAAAVLCRST
jgi:hypothetical protein